jgi:CheY-like chemotaxis protein
VCSDVPSLQPGAPAVSILLFGGLAVINSTQNSQESYLVRQEALMNQGELFLQVPVVALSENVDELLQFETRKSNFDAWLSKPLNAQELINIIEKWRHLKHSFVVRRLVS